MFMKGRHWALYWESHLIIFFQIRPGFLSCFFPLDFHTNILYAFLFLKRDWQPSHPNLYFNTLIIFMEENMSWSSLLCNILHPLVTFSSINPNIFISTLSQKISIYVLSFMWETHVTTTQQHRRNYISVSFNPYIYRSLHFMSIPKLPIPNNRCMYVCCMYYWKSVLN